jgi:hypothetical protein
MESRCAFVRPSARAVCVRPVRACARACVRACVCEQRTRGTEAVTGSRRPRLLELRRFSLRAWRLRRPAELHCLGRAMTFQPRFSITRARVFVSALAKLISNRAVAARPPECRLNYTPSGSLRIDPADPLLPPVRAGRAPPISSAARKRYQAWKMPTGKARDERGFKASRN